MKDEFQNAVIQAIVKDLLGAISFNDSPDYAKLSPRQLQLYRSRASLALRNAAFQGESKRLVDKFRETIDLSTKNDTERAYYRGAIFGLLSLANALKSLSPSGKTDLTLEE